MSARLTEGGCAAALCCDLTRTVTLMPFTVTSTGKGDRLGFIFVGHASERSRKKEVLFRLWPVDQVLPRRGDTLPLPFGETDDNDEAANGPDRWMTIRAAVLPCLDTPHGLHVNVHIGKTFR